MKDGRQRDRVQKRWMEVDQKRGRWSQVGRVKVEKGWRGVKKKQMQNILSKEGENENN